MSDLSLLIRDDAALSVVVPEASASMKAEALGSAALVVAVTNDIQQEFAVGALKDVASLLQATEACRKQIKGPIIDFGRLIDDAAKDYSEALQCEKHRLQKLIADYQALVQARARAEEAKRNEELSKLEKEREAAIANATSLEDIQRAKEESEQKVAALPPAIISRKPAGLSSGLAWEFEIENAHLLYTHHPHLVTIEPKRAEIKAALKAGIKIRGVRAWQETRASVRANKRDVPAFIEPEEVLP